MVTSDPADNLLSAMSAINGMKQYQAFFGLEGGAGKTCELIITIHGWSAY
jgi:hypothetical protein